MRSVFSRASFKSEKSCGKRIFEGEAVASKIIVPTFSPFSDASVLSFRCFGVEARPLKHISLNFTSASAVRRFRNETNAGAVNGHFGVNFCKPMKY